MSLTSSIVSSGPASCAAGAMNEDRRRNVLELTTDGLRAIERFEQVAMAVDDVVLRGLDEEERATLRHLLQKVVTSREPKG